LFQVKHLLYEHQNNVTQLKEAGEMALKLQLEEHQVQGGRLASRNGSGE
jgi:hypothetical protein